MIYESDRGSAVMKMKMKMKMIIAMLMVQAIATGMQLLTRLILIQGTFIFALMAYRHVIAAIFVAPLAFYFERGQVKRFGWSVWLWLFLNALTGITFAMGMFYYGLRDTTATYATNFLNLIPIVTFLFSIITGIEELKLKTRAGKVKSFGAMLCLAGALTTSLYSGHEFHIGHRHKSPVTAAAAKFSGSHWGRGTFFLVGSCISYSVWFIVQVKLQKVFPFKYTATMLTCIIASIQSLVVGLCLDSHKSAWKLGFNLQLITIVYSGSLATAATFCLILWVIAKQGPTYPSMFNPLTLIFVAVSEALLLGEALWVGTLIGMVLIILGIYSFLWGKGKEHKVTSLDEARKTSIEPQSSATVVPSSSPIRDDVIILHVDDQSSHNKPLTIKNRIDDSIPL